MKKVDFEKIDLNVGDYEVRIKSAPAPEKYKIEVAKFDDLNWDDCNDLISDVAVLEKGWPIQDLPKEYAQDSVFVVAYDGDALVGIAMIITGDPESFPIRKMDAWPNLSIPMSRSAEIPFVLVKKDYRGSSGVSFKLCASCYWFLVQNKIDFVELTLDRRLWNFYKTHGMNMIPITSEKGGGIKTHWDEPGIFPARLYVGLPDEDGSWGHGVKTSFPGLWKIFISLKPKDPY